MDEGRGRLSGDVCLTIKPRQWWIFFELTEPRTTLELSTRSGLVEASVQTHLRALASKGVVVPGPSTRDGEVRYRQAVELTTEQEEQARGRIRSARLKPAAVEHVPTPGRSERRAHVPAILAVACMAAIAVAFAIGAGGDDVPAADAAGGSSSVAPRALSNDSSDPTSAPDSRAGEKSPRPRHQPSKPRTTQPAFSEEEVSDQAFLLQIQTGDYPYFQGVPDEQLTNLGHALCGDLDDGFDPYALAFQVADQTEADEIEAAGLVGAAMGAYCPRHSKSW